MLLGSLEATATNQLICAVGDGKCKILDRIIIPLTDPAETLGKAIKYFRQFHDLNAIGISSFGPLELRNYSPKYGYIMDSSRPKWQNINLLGTLKHYLNVPMSFTTDVNSIAYGVYIDSVLRDKPIFSLAYITISDGVGVGIVNQGKFIGNQGSPEIGHIFPKRMSDDQTFKGVCPYQGDCLEGLVSTKAFEARFHKSYKELSMFNPVWQDVANYIAQSLVQTTLFIRPKKIFLGGSVVNPLEFDKVKAEFKRLLNNYVDVGNVDNYLQFARNDSTKLAIIGNLSLAKNQFYSEKTF